MTSRNSDVRNVFGGRISALPVAAALLTLLSICSAQSTQPVFTIDATVLSICTILLIIMSGLLAIAFAISRLLGVTSFEAWVREEYAELILTAILLVLFGSFGTLVESAAGQMAGDILTSSVSTGGTQSAQTYWSYNAQTGRWGPGSMHCDSPCQFYVARAFLGSLYETYYNQLMSTARYLSASRMWESLVIGPETTIYSIVTIGFGMPLYSQKAVLNNSLETVVDMLLKALLSVKTQEIMLQYLSFLPVPFFTAGIVFRIPWVTRKLGGLLIAIALGVYIFPPLIYTLGWYTVDKTTVIVQMTPIDTASITTGNLVPLEDPDASILFTDYTCTHQETYGCASYIESKVGLLDIAARTLIATLLMPILAIFTTIGFVRQFSPTIGGDAEIAGLTRLI